MLGVSVIICCYNSVNRLSRTISCIAKQKILESCDYELIIVNNNSTDNTEIIAYEEINKYQVLKHRSHIIYEAKSGLSFARKAGVANAKFDLVLFCDDDNWLDENYLHIGIQTYQRHPDCVVLGGNGIPHPEIHPPEWFNYNQRFFAVGAQGNDLENITTKKGCVYGAGAFFKKGVLDEIYNSGYESLLTDRKGGELTSGGDTEICYIIRLIGGEIYYNKDLIFEHFIPKERLTISYVTKLNKAIAKSTSTLSTYTDILNSRLYKWHKENIFYKLLATMKNTNFLCSAANIAAYKIGLQSFNNYPSNVFKVYVTLYNTLKTNQAIKNRAHIEKQLRKLSTVK